MDIHQRAKNYIQRSKALNYPPKILNIEPTNLCNLNCLICVEKKERKQGFLKKESLEKIILNNQSFNIDNEFYRKCPAMKKSHNITKKKLISSKNYG